MRYFTRGLRVRSTWHAKMTGARTTTFGMSASATPISFKKLMRFCMVRSTRYSSTRGCASSNYAHATMP
eukprot:2128157-Pyramimonas_sp.AAC.1